MAAKGRKKTILLVDDDENLLGVLSTAFTRAGWEVGQSTDGEEVFRKLTAYEPFGLLLDVYMPKIDGVEVCRLIKGHPVWRDSYLVVMSARLEEPGERMFRSLGADKILHKPFEPEQAVELFEHAFAKVGANG